MGMRVCFVNHCFFNLEFFPKIQSHDIVDCCCIRLMLFEDLGSVNLRHEISMYVFVGCDYWWCCYRWKCWYEMMLLLMIILTKNDVVIGDNIDMRMMLLLMIMWHEVMLLFMIILKWDDVDDDNVIEMRWCLCW